MLLKVHSASVLGIQAQVIDIEVDLSLRGKDAKKYHVVGLPDTAIKESGERVRAARFPYNAASRHSTAAAPLLPTPS